MICRYRAPAVVIVLTCASALGVSSLDSGGPVRTLAGAVVLFLPGYVLSSILLGRREGDWALRTLVSLGVSVSVVVLAGLVIDRLATITADSLALGLAAVAVGGAVIGAAISRPVSRWGLNKPAIRGGLLLLPAIVIAAVAVGLSVSSARKSQDKVHFAQVSLTSGEGDGVHLQLQAFGPVRDYRVELRVGARTVRSWVSVPLGRGQRWTRDVEVTGKSARRVRALVYREGKPKAPYRAVTLERPS